MLIIYHKTSRNKTNLMFLQYFKNDQVV